MNKMDFLNDLNEIDAQFLKEAEPKKMRPGNARKVLVWALAVAAVLVTIGLSIWLHEKNGKILPETSDPGKDQQIAETPGTEPSVTDKEPSMNDTSEAPDSKKDPEILFENDSVKVTVITEHVQETGRSEACLAYLTERELLEYCDVVLRARVTEITNISLEDKHSHWISEGCILTLEPGRVLRGELRKEGEITVFVSKYINTSLEGLTYSLQTAEVGREGLLMLYDNSGQGYMKEIADYSVGDSMRFAIWGTGSGLLFEPGAFPGFSKRWTLDEAEEYARSVIGNNEAAPQDFAFTISWKYWGHDESENQSFSFDSRDGSYSLEGDKSYEKIYGAENLSASLQLTEKELDEMYRTLKRISDLPENLPASGKAGDIYTEVTDIWFRANGAEKHVSYSGASYREGEDFQTILSVRTMLHHYLMESASYHEWSDQMEGIAAARREETSKEIMTVLQAAFDAKYGPGGSPAYFQGMQIVPGGFLMIYLVPCSYAAEQEIHEILHEYQGGYLFADGFPD